MQRTINRKRIALLLIVSVLVTSVICTGLPAVRAASDLKATGRVNATSGAYIRSEASTSSKDLMVVKHKTKLVITKEVFVKDGSTKSKNRWYAVTVNGKDGYIRSDLVNNIDYDGITMQTTDALNYRIGPDVGMTRRGTFSKGAKINVVLQASLKMGGATWYKVEKDGNYYYVDSHYVTNVKSTSSSKKTTTTKKTTTKKSSSKTTTEKSGKSTTTKDTKDTKTTTTSAAAAAVTLTQPKEEEPPISKGTIIEGTTYPRSLAEGCPYTLKGVIKSANKITSVKVGVTDTEGNWVILQEAEPDSYTFDIATVDAKIKMGTLGVGSYIYKIQAVVSKKTKTLGEYSFTVKRVEGPKRLTEKALECVWPMGTSSSKYTYGKGKPTSAYLDALDTAFGSRKKWGKATKNGASCDVFVSTVCRASGYDTKVPQGVQGQWRYFASSSRWDRVAYNYSESNLKSGDVVIYKKKNGRWHVCMYVKIGSKGVIAEASYKKRYGFINTSLSKILKKDKAKIAVYRAKYD